MEDRSCHFDTNPFEEPKRWRQTIRKNVRLSPELDFDGKGFICALVNSRCPVGCTHCMFGSNMSEEKNTENTMTETRVSKLMKLVRDANVGYLLVSGGGEGFIEPERMYQIAEGTTADVTWMVTGAHWAKDSAHAKKVVDQLYAAFERGRHDEYGREVCLRISLDSYHVEQISRGSQNRLTYVENLIRLYESEYADEKNFTLKVHSIEGEEELIEELIETVDGERVERYASIHDREKVTEKAFTVTLDSGYEFEVTFAKRLYSDLAPDLHDEELLQKRIEVFEKDAYENEHGRPAIQRNSDGSIGPDMLAIYDGRVSFWQSEMPDVPINIDSDDFESIREKSLSDPGVLGTVENGLGYRFEIIEEVCPKAVRRAKAVNIRDYTSPVLLQEHTVKLYYTIRSLQDFVSESRISDDQVDNWPSGIRTLVDMDKATLQELYHESDYDILQQFIENDGEEQFEEFISRMRAFAQNRDPQAISKFFKDRPSIDPRTVDEWRLLLERIDKGWYDIDTLSDAELAVVGEIERIMDERLLGGTRIYEGLSARAMSS